MSEAIWIALLVSTVGPAVLFGMTRMFGGSRKDLLAEWQSWSTTQTERIEKLEERVKTLEDELEEERETSRHLRESNERKQTLMRALLQWALLLRDEVIRLDGDLPPTPPDVEAAMTTLHP